MKKEKYEYRHAAFKSMVLLPLLLLLCGNNATAQNDLLKSEYSHRRYSVSDGLPENRCWSLFQDSKGYIWVSTYNGFARYDGQQFKLYWQDKQTNVQEVTENREGNITAVCFLYYAVLDPLADTLKIIEHPEWRLITCSSQNMPTGYFFYESQEKERRIALFQVSDTGLVKRWEHECLKQINMFKKPYWDQANRKFYIPGNQYVYIVNEENNIIQDSITHTSIYTIFPYKKSIGAFGTDGIYMLENQKLTRIYEKTFVANPSGIQAIIDKENRLIIRDVENIYRFDNKNLEHIFSNTAFLGMLFDRENNLWTATYTGLFNLFNLQFRNFTITDKDDMIRSVYANEDKAWIATYQGHLYNIKNNIAEEFIIPRKSGYSYFQGTPGKMENNLFFPGGYLDADVLQFDGKKGAWMNLPAMPYSFVLPLPNRQILFLHHRGIIIYDYAVGKVVRNMNRKELYQQPSCATVDKEGKLLLGGPEGITIIDKDSIYLMPDTPDNFGACRVLITDRNGKIWASSNNMLFSVDNGAVKYEYKFNEHIRGVHVTKDNLLIVLTQKGIHIKRPGETDFIYYDKNNGFTGETIIVNQLAEDSEENIWFLADKFAVCFNPNELLQRQNAPILHIQPVKISKDNIKWENAEAENNQFSYRNKNVKFQYIGLNYSVAENVRYHYRLRGFQDDWSEPTKNREVIFNNLPPGNYVFEIYADAGTDDSRSETQSFAFSIKPAFWQTIWFFALCIIFLILASAGTTIYFQRRKNRALLEKLRVEKELNELRISSIRLKAIPHFNANVLAAIEYYITNRTKEDAMRILGIYSDFTFKTLSEVDKAARPISEELAYVKMYLDLEKVRFIDKFDFTINVEEGIDKSVQLPNMILHTYCENAVKHGLMPLKSGGMLNIHASQHNNIVCVSVEDNGVGRIQAAQNPQFHSSKQGLSILNRQIEIYNSFNCEKITHRVEDLEVGTRFTVEVPVGFTYFN